MIVTIMSTDWKLNNLKPYHRYKDLFIKSKIRFESKVNSPKMNTKAIWEIAQIIYTMNTELPSTKTSAEHEAMPQLLSRTHL